MKILILGGEGMLGHKLILSLRDKHEVFASIRGVDYLLDRLGILPREKIYANLDVRSRDMNMVIRSIRPDVVINCIGILHHLGGEENDPASMIRVNALFPHDLANACLAHKARLIHFSTDCVFSGTRGGYVESDKTDPDSLYGRTKQIGELWHHGAADCLTIRSSFIGEELRRRDNLLEWFLVQSGTIDGYARAYFSGVTTNEMGKILSDYILPNPSLSGLYHISGPKISKYDLLEIIRDVFHRDIKIHPVYEPIIDRSLNGDRFKAETGCQSPSWKEMVKTLFESREVVRA